MTSDGYQALDQEAYRILAACTDDELSPIVDAFGTSQFSTLKLTRAYELHAPRHSRYADLIADEVYRLGVLSLKQRDGARPTYAQMLAGVCKQLGLTQPSEDVEGDLLNLFASRHPLSAAAPERQALVDEACTAAGIAASGVFSSEEWPPFAAALLHVAHLRRQLTDQGRLAAQASGPEPVTALPCEAELRPMIVETQKGSPLFAVTTVSAIDNGRWTPAANASGVTTVLGPLLLAVQPFASAQELLGAGNVYRAILPAGTTLSFREKLGAFVGSAEGVKGQVPFQKVTLSSLAGPAAIPILITAYWEQKRSEQLMRDLADIKAAIGLVAAFQQEERRSVLTGSVRYYQQVAAAVLAGETAPEVLHVVEQHELRLVQLQEHLSHDIARQVRALSAIRNESWTSNTKYVAALDEALNRVGGLFTEILLCLRARACGFQLLAAFPGRDEGKRQRRRDIAEALDAFSLTGEMARSIDRALREKLAKLSLETKFTLLAQQNWLFKAIARDVAVIAGGLDAASPSEFHAEQIAIDITIKDGGITAVRLPDQASAQRQFAELIARPAETAPIAAARVEAPLLFNMVG